MKEFLIENLSSLQEAAQALTKNEFWHDRILHLEGTSMYYFMQNDSDIAYYCADTQNLLIHGNRRWSKDFLERYVEVNLNHNTLK